MSEAELRSVDGNVRPDRDVGLPFSKWGEAGKTIAPCFLPRIWHRQGLGFQFEAL